MERAQKIVEHLALSDPPSRSILNATSSSADDVVIVQALRTPICKAKKGGFKDTHPADLLAAVLKAVVDKAGIPASAVNDVVVGNVLAPGAFATQARMALFMANFPETTSVHTVNRQCSSGLQAFASVASAIKSGFYDVGIAGTLQNLIVKSSVCRNKFIPSDTSKFVYDTFIIFVIVAGVESMSMFSMGGSVGDLSDNAFKFPRANDCLIPMGVTSENVAEKFGITREMQVYS